MCVWHGWEREECLCVGGGGSSGEEERGYDIINFCLFIIKTFFPF